MFTLQLSLEEMSAIQTALTIAEREANESKFLFRELFDKTVDTVVNQTTGMEPKPDNVCGFCFSTIENGRKVKVDGVFIPACNEHFSAYVENLKARRVQNDPSRSQ